MSPAENISRQVGIIQTAINKQFSGDPAVNAGMVATIGNLLAKVGTTDVRDLHWYEDKAANLAFFFDVKTSHVFTNPLTHDVQWQDDPAARHVIFTYQTPDDNYRVFCVLSTDGFPIFYATHRSRGSAWLDFAHAILMLASIAVSVAFPQLGVALGQAILGPTVAAAYPALASAVGNAVLTTAFNGGDVKAAAIGAIGGYAGGLAGGAVSTATDSRIIGAVASTAVKTAVVGGDLKMAVGQTLLSNGVQSMSQLEVFSGGANVKLASVGDYGDLDPFSDANYSPPEIELISGGAIGPVSLDLPAGYLDPYAGMPATSPAYQDVYASMPATGSVVLADPLAPPSGPGGILASINGADLTKLAMTTLQLVAAFRNAGAPPVMGSNGVATANPNGTLTTRNANGTVSTRPMPVGTPYLTTSGALVTNNGDGTYTTIDANGHPTIARYTATTAGISSLGLGSLTGNMPLMLGLAAVAAVVLLKGK